MRHKTVLTIDTINMSWTKRKTEIRMHKTIWSLLYSDPTITLCVRNGPLPQSAHVTQVLSLTDKAVLISLNTADYISQQFNIRSRSHTIRCESERSVPLTRSLCFYTMWNGSDTLSKQFSLIQSHENGLNNEKLNKPLKVRPS